MSAGHPDAIQGRTISDHGHKGVAGRPLAAIRLIDRVVGIFDLSGAVVVTATATAIFLALFVNVLLRYALGEGITWAYEIPAILFPWLVAGGIVMASARSRNIAVTALSDLFGPRAHWLLMLAVHVLIAVIAVTVIVTGKPIMIASKFQKLSETGIRQIWGYSSLIYAFGSIVVLSVLNVLRLLFGGQAADDCRDTASYS
ncbi:MAG: TRAP transporter small permease subunit [Rhodocyclaceae bacterium]|nr:TRAP transporter small permease subunit [Rhodocyclaceae bacterium]